MPVTFELKTSTGIVSLLWNNWAMHRFCEMNGEVDAKGKVIPIPAATMWTLLDGQVLTFKHIIQLVKAASEGADNEITEREASKLIDAGGGLTSPSSQILRFIEYVIRSGELDIPADKNVPEEEKKS
jgi:hypothetical protein